MGRIDVGKDAARAQRRDVDHRGAGIPFRARHRGADPVRIDGAEQGDARAEGFGRRQALEQRCRLRDRRVELRPQRQVGEPDRRRDQPAFDPQVHGTVALVAGRGQPHLTVPFAAAEPLHERSRVDLEARADLRRHEGIEQDTSRGGTRVQLPIHRGGGVDAEPGRQLRLSRCRCRECREYQQRRQHRQSPARAHTETAVPACGCRSSTRYGAALMASVNAFTHSGSNCVPE